MLFSTLVVETGLKPCLTFEQDQTETKQRPFQKANPREIQSTRFENLPRHSKADSSTSAEEIFKTYLDRQGRNEYVNLASEIGYDGNNIAFVFYESQVRRLMSESPCSERHLEIIRASYIGQPRELVNLFFAPMKNLSTSEWVEKAIARLRERYGVLGGLITEPEIVRIRTGSKVVHTVALLKSFNEDLNTLEVFAYAHDEIEKLSGQLLLDVANRFPGVLKRRYLDYLKQIGLDLNRPGFDSLRKFIVNELSIMMSEYAQTFFKSNDKEKSRDPAPGSLCVRQVGVEMVEQSSDGEGLDKQGNSSKKWSKVSAKSPPNCFLCANEKLKHFLGDCAKFKKLSIANKRKKVIEAGRCLNCLSVGHFVRNCELHSKCYKCGPKYKNKHSGVLHEFYSRSTSVNLGATKPVSTEKSNEEKTSTESVVVRKMVPNNNNLVLLRTSAVKVINPSSGKCALVYAQHDTASQVTLILERLSNELGLEMKDSNAITIRTLA